MATTTRQTALFGTEDWKKIYKTYKDADFQSFNFETMRKTFVDYLQYHHPETFTDYTESSEFIALLDVMSFMGQSLSFRNDLNTRENFLDTAERRDSVSRLAKLISYNVKRNEASRGFVRIDTISTTENLIDYNQNSLAGVTVRWNDKTNDDWQEQFTTILNAALINTQKVGNPGNSAELIGVKTDEYQVNVVDGFLPIIPFNAQVDNVGMDFELVNGTSQNKDYIYEPEPHENGQFNILYRNDNLGYNGPNTGYFFYFKQGTLLNEDFTFVDQIKNRTYDVPINGVNENDVWLFKIDPETKEYNSWDKVENIYSTHDNQTEQVERPLYSITSRTNDQITLLFGDGIFSTIPLGTFRSYVRSSNGLEYVINPSEMQGIEISLIYQSKSGRSETVTFTVSLTQPVSNSRNKENLDDIKLRAPARFYTQNRMVNGEDYNNFPYTSFGSIIKSKAVNRTNIGASRYLDLVDPTGKYSSINTFGDDGLLYEEDVQKSFTFIFNDRNDIESVIANKIEPLIASREMIQFYYNKFPRPSLTDIDIQWHQSTTFTNETTGYYMSSASTPLALGSYVTDNRQYILPNSLIKYIPPEGYHFSGQNRLIQGASIKPDDKMEVWASVKSVVLDGSNFGDGNFDNGIGPVTLNNFIPTNAIPVQIITPYNTDLDRDLEESIIPEVELNRNFGLGYDNDGGEWYLITHDNIDLSGDFSLENAQSDLNQNDDASWMMKFESTINGYIVTSRSIKYYFGSVLETRFFYGNDRRIYDIKQGNVVNDYIKILKTNSVPDSHRNLDNDLVLDIIDQTVEPDGYVNDFNVEVSFSDLDADGIADDPDFFSTFVNPDVNGYAKHVFFEATQDFDNLVRWLPLATNVINDEYSTKDEIELVKTEYADGQLFYAYSEDKFYESVVDPDAITLNQRTDLSAKVGRGDVQFQYRHNSPDTRRINPGVSNIIDIFIVTNSYYDLYSNYMQDTTNTVEEPDPPSTDELLVEYNKLQDRRMVSDNIILSSVIFKPLFGPKAEPELQATIKVIKLQNVIISNSEVKSKVIKEMNKYFDINVWDFGDTFFFSELSSYLHKNLGDILASVVIVSKDTTKPFGDLYEIKSMPQEIFINSATVNEVEVIDALTPNNLQIGVS